MAYPQRRIDIVLDDLELTLEEREWLQEHWRHDRRARRLVNLIADYLERPTWRSARAELAQMVEAIADMRAARQAERAMVPAGYVLVDEQLLETMQELAYLAHVWFSLPPAARPSWASHHIVEAVRTVEVLSPAFALRVSESPYRGDVMEGTDA